MGSSRNRNAARFQIFRRTAVLEMTLTQLVDTDLAPLLERYKVLQRFIAGGEAEPEDIALFLDDLNTRFESVLDRIAT